MIQTAQAVIAISNSSIMPILWSQLEFDPYCNSTLTFFSAIAHYACGGYGRSSASVSGPQARSAESHTGKADLRPLSSLDRKGKDQEREPSQQGER